MNDEPQAPCAAPSPWNRWDWLALALVVVLAGLLRVGWPEACEWKSDEALHYLRAAELARGERLSVLVGYQTSAGGARLPAVFHYMLALPCLLGLGPAGLCAAVGLWNTAGIALLFAWGRRLLGRRAAFGAALVLSVAPYLVLHARAIRNEELLPTLAVCLLLCMLEALRAPGSRRGGLAAGGAVAVGVIMVQVHLSAGFFVLPQLGALALLALRRRVAVRRLAPGLLVALLSAAPFLTHELGSGFRETRAALGGVLGGEVSGKAATVHAWTPLAMPTRTANQLTRVTLPQHIGEELPLTALEGLPRGGDLLLAAGSALAVGLALLGCWVLVLRARGAPTLRRARARVLSLALLAPWALFVILQVDARVPYVLVFTPALAMVVGLAGVEVGRRALSSLGQRHRRGARAALLGAAAVLLSAQALYSASLLRRLARGGAPGTLYGVTWEVKREAAQWILERGGMLGRYPAFEYVMTLDVVGRQLSPELAARFSLTPQVVPYWGQPFLLPIPRGSGPAPVFDLWEGRASAKGAVARFGAIALTAR